MNLENGEVIILDNKEYIDLDSLVNNPWTPWLDFGTSGIFKLLL